MGGFNPFKPIKKLFKKVVKVATSALSWLKPSFPNFPDTSFGENAMDTYEQGVLLNKQSNNASIPVVYGERLVGGTIIFLETSGSSNEYLYVALVLSEGEINSIEKIIVDDKTVTWTGSLTNGTVRDVSSGDNNFYKSGTSHIRVQPFFGTDTQTVSSVLDPASGWGSNHRLRGISYLALRFKWNGDIFSSIPKIQARIKGKKVKTYNSSLVEQSASYKTNPAWCILDYLTNERYGKGLSTTDIDLQSFYDASVICETQVTPYTGKTSTLSAGINNSVTSIVLTSASSFPSSGTIQIDDEKITYTGKSSNTLTGCVRGALSTTAVSHLSGATVNGIITNINIFNTNYVLDTSRRVIDNLRELIKGCRGYIPYTQGKYQLIIETTGTASLTLSEDNIIGGYNLVSSDKNSKYNRVIVSFINPKKSYQADEVQFPPLDDSGLPSADQHATMKALDGGILLEGKFDFPTLTSPYQAEEMAEIILRRSRESISLEINCDFNAYDLSIGEIVNITHGSLGFSAKPFRVLGISFNEDYSIGLSLIEHQNSHYTWATKTEEETVPTTNLPDPFTIQPPASVTLTDDLVEYNDGTVITRLSVLIGASIDQFIDQYEVELRQDTDRSGTAVVDDFKVVGRGIALRHQVLNVIDNATYTIRVRGINALGVKSTYVTEARQIIGQTAVPQDVENFSINVLGDQALLSWTAIPDLDLDYYVLKFSTDLVTPTWQNSIDLVDRIGRPATSVTLPLLTGSFLIKAQDKLGNQSSNETIVTTNIASVNFVNQTTINEHTAFTGTKSGVELITRDATNYIGLTATGTVGDTATRVPATGTYDFANTIDLGAKFKGQFTASVTQFIEDVSEVFDNGRPDATTLFDDGRPNPFDGTSSGDAHTILEISTSDDNVTFSAFKAFTIGEHIGRYFKFRVLFTSDNLKARALIEELTVTASLSKRNESGNDISSGTGGKAITFDFGFKLNPAIGISAQSMGNGDYYTITSKSTTGFTIEFFNSSATSIDRSFDYIVQGVGQVII
jgi:hypothetical protein